MSQSENGYVTYQNMLNDVNSSMADVRKACAALNLDARVSALDEMKTRLNSDDFSVGIMGEFRRGKSTVINALLGREIVPADIVPTSATPNYIRWGASPSAEIHYKDGTSKTVQVDELSHYITKINEEYAKTAETVSDAVVYYPCQFCQNGVQIVDTPGLNDDERMTYISERVLSTLDAIIMVLVPDSPFSSSEADFVANKVMVSDLGRIIFVLNKIDLIDDEDDRKRLIDEIKRKIQSSVEEKMARLYGENSKEYEAAKGKMDGIRLYPISARNALKGRVKNDAAKLQESGIQPFEEALTKLLTEERGLLKLMVPVNQTRAAISEASQAAVARYESLSVDHEKFHELHAAQKEEWIKKRDEKKRIVGELKNKAANLYTELVALVPGMYDELETEMLRFVDGYPISEGDVKSDAAMNETAEKMGKRLQSELQSCLANDVEKLTLAIQERVGEDLIDATNFGREIGESIIGINGQISKEEGLSTGAIMAIDLATNCLSPFLSIGGVLEGWKANGLPGALVGGVGGATAGIAAMFALAAAGWAIVPMLAIGSVVTTLTGKGLVNAVFKSKKTEKNIARIKDGMRAQIREELKSVRSARQLENWLREQTDKTYNEMSAKVDAELEGLLADFEKQMDEINAALHKSDSEQEQLKKRMENLNKTLEAAAKRIEPVYKKLSESLNLEGEGPQMAGVAPSLNAPEWR